MPNFALHVLLATRLADSWRQLPEQAPFDVDAPASRNAFLHGAIGPDMGMYPGGDRFLSDVVHRVRTGRLTRALLAAAETDAQRAFAWGWLTHVIADAELHPVVNRAAAEALGREEIRLEDPLHHAAHVRVELGLDSEYLGRYEFLRRPQLSTALDRSSVGFVLEALRQTYGVEFDGEALLRSHRAVVRLHRHLLLLGRSVARRWGHADTASVALAAMHPLLSAARWLAAAPVFPSHSEFVAFLDPLRPSRELLTRFDAYVRRFPRIVHRWRAGSLQTLPDFDLESGGIEDPARPSPGAAGTLRSLAERSQRVPAYAGLPQVA